MQEQPGANLWELSDLCTPWCVHVVATLRIADHIAAGQDQIDNLAVAANCDPYALHRVLTHLVGNGVFEEPSHGRFALNEAARGLLDPALRPLKKVINDWPDREATAILSRCADAARANGRVVVLGGVGPDVAPRPLSIEMMLAGGRQRTVAEFREVAREAGLDVLAAARQPSGYFVVECRPD